MKHLRTKFMSSLAVFALAMAPALAQESAPAKEEVKSVTFKSKGLAVNDKVVVTGKSSMSQTMKVESDGQVLMENKSSTESNIRSTCVVKAAKEGKPTKVSIVFNKIEIEEEDPMAEMQGVESKSAKVQALDGKSFLLNLSAAPIAVTDLKGEEVPESEAKTVRERLVSKSGKFIGFGPDVSKAIPDGAMKIGTKIELTPYLIADILGMTDDDQIGDPKEFISGSMTLTGTRKVLGHECGVFEVKMKLDGSPETEGGPELQIKGSPTGELLVGLENKWVYRADAKGDINFTGEMEQGEMIIELDGSAKIKSNTVSIFSKDKPKAE
ncbi:MAG: hypothetical protein V3W41_17775 [Planctomycetota bacterium]